ncbi:unnamed protein product (macronuclear) [Paramecium tetraurelia]|uniref:Uncharacterized protein n=1 Tax=Paramecium tetraurelia TaxID=5888 RepID=A0CT78_PARTE|nr:uncharacterized protein GSPATT00010229001 [Paramecium tetraurelia]CAK73995.1 unnamed protein product [Paramecium tetraurelia]|eukprot:XP_001441392.1 hypothetical protein (macronuclear) [Paramecium tetraurelia strain d4-2]
MNQPIQDNVCLLLKSESTYSQIQPYLDKIKEKDQQVIQQSRKFYEPICQAIISVFFEQEPIQCFQAARMAKEAIEKQNLDFLTVFQNVCLKSYEQLAEDTLNVRLADKASQFFNKSGSDMNFGKSFFHLILESIENWARLYPKKNDGITPTLFYQTYQNLLNKGIKFPQANYFKEQQSIKNNYNNQKLEILKDLQQQIMAMKQLHEIELTDQQQQNNLKIFELQEQLQYFQNMQPILKGQIEELQKKEEKYKKDFEYNQQKLKQLESELRNNKLNGQQYLNEQLEKLNLESQIQELQKQIQELEKNNSILTEKLEKQGNGRQIQNNQYCLNQLNEQQIDNMNLKKELEKKEAEIKEQKFTCLEQAQNINQLKLQLKAREKLNQDIALSRNQDQEQLISKLQQNIENLKKNIELLEGENGSYQFYQQEQQKRNQKLEEQLLNAQQKLQVSENKIKELQSQLDQLKQISPARTNSNSAKILIQERKPTQYQNFFFPEAQQNQQFFNPRFQFNEDLISLFTRPKPIEVEKVNPSDIYPHQTAEEYYSKAQNKQNKGQEVVFKNLISQLKDLSQKNQCLSQMFHINRTTYYFIDKPSIFVAIIKQVQKQGEQNQVKFGVYFKTDEQTINLSGKFLNLQKMLKYFSSSQKDFNVTLETSSQQQQKQYLLEYQINDDCEDISELPVLEIKYKGKVQQLFLPMPIQSFIEFSQITQDDFKAYWKQLSIFRSKKFCYNLLVLPSYQSITNISTKLILINEDKLKSYLQGIDEIKYGAKFKILGSQLKGLIKFELIPQNKIVIYVGIKKEQTQQYQVLATKIINYFNSMFQII